METAETAGELPVDDAFDPSALDGGVDRPGTGHVSAFDDRRPDSSAGHDSFGGGLLDGGDGFDGGAEGFGADGLLNMDDDGLDNMDEGALEGMGDDGMYGFDDGMIEEGGGGLAGLRARLSQMSQQEEQLGGAAGGVVPALGGAGSSSQPMQRTAKCKSKDIVARVGGLRTHIG